MDKQWGLSEEDLARMRQKTEEEPGGVVSPGRAPRIRMRTPYGYAGKGPTFVKYETTNGYVIVGNVDQEIIRFQGVPSEIEIFVLANPIVVKFLDEPGEHADEIRLEANNFYNPQIRANRIIARAAVPDNECAVQVVGKWAEELSTEEIYGR